MGEMVWGRMDKVSDEGLYGIYQQLKKRYSMVYGKAGREKIAANTKSRLQYLAQRLELKQDLSKFIASVESRH
jgi:hypothetical protein